MSEAKKLTGLDLLRAPFPAHQISKLPKPYKKDSPKGQCRECGGYHGLPAAHLDYVGHAALTDRLLDCDPAWNWEPVAFNDRGTPAIDENGGMWIKLTVCGVTRLGYGHPDGKRGGDAVKELIGDALRNAAMRFGAALDLWHKGDLHGVEDDDSAPAPSRPVIDDRKPQAKPGEPQARDPDKIRQSLIDAIAKCESAEALEAMNADGTKFSQAWQWLEDQDHKSQAAAVKAAYDAKMKAAPADLGGDYIPYEGK